MKEPEQYCKFCDSTKPLREEFWHRSKKSKSGFSNRCKVCTAKYQSIVGKKFRDKIREAENKRLRGYEPEVFGAFGARALSQEVKKPSVVFSIDRVI